MTPKTAEIMGVLISLVELKYGNLEEDVNEFLETAREELAKLKSEEK